MFYGLICLYTEKREKGFIQNIQPNYDNLDKISYNIKDFVFNKNQSDLNLDVTFDIETINGKIFAKNIQLYSSLTIEEKKELVVKFEGDILHTFVYNLIKNDIKFNQEEERIICKKLIEKPMKSYPFLTWDILQFFNKTEYKIQFIELLKNSSDLMKLIRFKNSKELLPIIANNWNFEKESFTQDLITRIKVGMDNLDDFQLFITQFKERISTFNYNTIISFYSLFEDPSQILQHIKTVNDIYAYKNFHSSIKFFYKDNMQNLLLSNLTQEIFKKVNNPDFYLDDEYRFKFLLLADKKDYYNLLKNWHGNSGYDYKLIKEIIETDKYISMVTIFNPILKKILDNEKFNDFDFDRPEYYPLEIYFHYILKFEDIDFFEYLIDTKLFNTQYILKSNLFHFNNPKIYSITEKLLFDCKNENVIIKVESIMYLLEKKLISIAMVKKIISLQINFLEIFILKKILQNFSRGKLNSSLLNEIIMIDEWTSLTTMLIVSFIKNKPKDKTSALECLSKTFKVHLFKISKLNILDNFEDLFTVCDIVKMCNGRKSYNIKKWSKEGIERQYTYKNQIIIGNCLNIYCEGRFWKKEIFYDSNTKKPFDVDNFWCRGDVCMGLNTNAEIELDYFDWTLVEISKVLKLNIDELIFSIIGGWVNRMNEIIKSLRCRSCNSILRPLPFDPNILGFYATPIFNCINENCTDYKNQIRFSHCLNGKCENLLDSRDLNTCTEGWMICRCGTCCPKHSNRSYMPKRVQQRK